MLSPRNPGKGLIRRQVSFGIILLGSLLLSSPAWAQCTSCENCPPPVLGFTSKQMSFGSNQPLTAIGGTGPYSWVKVSGGGNLSGSSGTSVTYTAPSSNANCANNPTIRVTDSCGQATDLKIAVSNPSYANSVAYDETYCPTVQGICYGSFTGPR